MDRTLRLENECVATHYDSAVSVVYGISLHTNNTSEKQNRQTNMQTR